MSQAIAGFIGAIAGALATIGTQGALGRLDRRNASRTGARILFGEVLEARDIMMAALRDGEWKSKRDMAHVIGAWNDYREPIARAVSAADFYEVAGAFKAIEFIVLTHERNASSADEGFGLARDRMADAIPRCDSARLILARASCTAWERYVTERPKSRERLVSP